MKPTDAKYIWYNDEGLGRNLYCLFRKVIEISGNVKSAVVNLFADTSYQLFINEKFVEFGPTRFNPQYPVYDCHDISEYLLPGKNVIGVKVNFFGLKTYKAIPLRAGMVAWGDVTTDKGECISLNTGRNSWRAAPDSTHSHYEPKISFALNTMEFYDQRSEQKGWKAASFDDSSWNLAVELEKQDSWGELSPRSMPFMSGKSISIPEVLSVLPLVEIENKYSFTVPFPFQYEKDYCGYSRHFVYSTWIYSPCNQTVTAGVFWGESWLNGEELPRGIDNKSKAMRQSQKWKLKEGWNHYFSGLIDNGTYQDVLNHHIALPKGKGLIVSADKNPDSGYIFKRSPLLKAEIYNKHLKTRHLPFEPDDNINDVGGWVYVTKEDKAYSPCCDTSWDEYGECLEVITPETLQNNTFKLVDYPLGFAVLMDLTHMNIVFPVISMTGVRGAVIDVTYSEHLCNDGKHMVHSHNYSSGDRLECSDDCIEWMPTHPRGLRYLKITVRNAGSDVTLKSISFRSANYPVEEKGWFKSSDQCLNEIWLMGQRTQAINMEDAYVDCPGRERGMYGRDTIIQYHNNLATFGDHDLFRRCMELYGQSPDSTGKFRAVYPNTGDYTISDFALNMHEGYLAYYENTGDKEIIEKYWDSMLGNIAWFNELADERDDLLLDSEWHTKKGIKAHYGGFHGDLHIAEGYMDNTGIHCVFSCTYLIALKCTIKLADIIGKTKDAQALQKRVDILSRTIPEKFWDSEKECYSDNLERTTHSAHASLSAVRAGVVSEEQLGSVRRHVSYSLRSLFVNGHSPTDGAFISPNYAFYIFDGLYKAGLVETAENLMKQGWGWMLSTGYKTCFEYFNTERTDNSLCHAWSASPTYYLSKNVLGINYPEVPNLDIVEIKVQTSIVTSAEGGYPHPKGVIEVKWHIEDGKRIFDYVKAPEGVDVKMVG